MDSSSDSRPAATNAAISPRLCPATAQGVMPTRRNHSSHCNDVIRMAGWEMRVSRNAASQRAVTAGESARSTGRSMKPDNPFGPRVANCESHLTRRSAAHSERLHRVRPMPMNWEPWPGIRNPTRKQGFARPSSVLGGAGIAIEWRGRSASPGRPSSSASARASTFASAASRARNSSTVSATTAMRMSAA